MQVNKVGAVILDIPQNLVYSVVHDSISFSCT